MSIPVIDLHDALHRGDARSAQVAHELRAAAMSSGFFYVKNHGVPASVVKRQFALARRLLEEVPLQTRHALDIRNSTAMRGYENLKTQRLDARARPDIKESFYCGPSLEADHPYVVAEYPNYGSNQWPLEVPGASAICDEYNAAILRLTLRLMQLMALSLNIDEGYFDALNGDPMVALRMIRYPAHPDDADELSYGAGAHTDFGALTLLAQDMHGGLEVNVPNDGWVEAPPIPETFIVNLGDMVPRWTNGVYRSNRHRVRNTRSGGKPRFSMPFFYQPDYAALIEAVPGVVPQGESPLFEPCTVGEHLTRLYRMTYGIADKESGGRLPDASDAESLKLKFITANGEAIDVETMTGQTLMQAAVSANVPGFVGECGGAMVCGTCHVYTCAGDSGRLPVVSRDEHDMLQFVAAERRPTSRLSCQIALTSVLDGIVVETPASQY